VNIKKTISFLCLFLAVAWLTGCQQNLKEREKKLNIILITIDALRADHLSTYGYQYQTSPHIDKFAEKSVLFEYAYCTTPKTSASIASLMTGLHPFVHRTRPIRDTLKKEPVTLAEALKMRGYFTSAIVDNSNLSKNFNFNRGFDQYLQVWDKTIEKEESTPYITQQILEFLSKNQKKPFFFWAHYIETHYPFLPPQQFIEDRPEGRLLQNIEPKIIAGAQRFVRATSTEGYFLSRYDGAVKYIDSELEKIIDLIYEKGYQKNSIIIVTADHGEELGEHNYFYNHGPLTFNSSTRVPLIIYWPNIRSRRIKQPVSLMDIYPTLLRQAGLVPPYDIQGVDLFEKPQNRFLFIQAYPGSFAVVSERYHLVRLEKSLGQELGLEGLYFFDLLRDPYEEKNIAYKRKNLVELMDKAYLDFYKKYESIASHDKPEEEPKLSPRELEQLKTLGYIR
jgi:arylsulfatase A-like enzyme